LQNENGGWCVAGSLHQVTVTNVIERIMKITMIEILTDTYIMSYEW
jgi:hypothetical protein